MPGLGREKGLKAHFDEGSMRGVGTSRLAICGPGCFPHAKAICNPIKGPCLLVAGTSQADIFRTERKGS